LKRSPLSLVSLPQLVRKKPKPQPVKKKPAPPPKPAKAPDQPAVKQPKPKTVPVIQVKKKRVLEKP